MNFIKTILLTALVSLPVFAHEETPGVIVVAKAVELGVHRIERLVTLKKIDAMFINQLYALKVERSSDAAKPYIIHGYSLPDAGNQSSTITMISDVQGKVVSHSVGASHQPANPVAWPEKDAVTLIEDGLHFVLEGWVQHPEVKAYYLGLTSITLAAGQDEAGQIIALVTATSDDDPRTLTIRLKTDGTVLSHEIK